jgi:hypothetical protein
MPAISIAVSPDNTWAGFGAAATDFPLLRTAGFFGEGFAVLAAMAGSR